MSGTLRYTLVYSITGSQGTTPYSYTLSRANPTTNTHKACAKLKSLMNLHLDGLEMFFNVYRVSPNSSKLQIAGVRCINRPPSP